MPADTEPELPPPLAVPAQTVIDIDESDGDEDVVFMGYARRAPSNATTEALENEGIAYMGYNLNSSGRSSSSGGAHAGPSRSARPERLEDLLVLSDDDDDNGPSSSRTGQLSRARRTRLISPPPPRTQRGHTPAVPPLPRHLASQASLPLARRSGHLPIRAPPDPPPIIRPREHPLPFERVMSLPRLPPRNPSSAPSSAPRSHHQPAMGFGGALLALNRQNAIEESNRRDREREARIGFNFPSFSEMFRRVSGYGAGSQASDGARAAPNARRWNWSFFEDSAEEADPLFDGVEAFPDIAPMFGLFPSKAVDPEKVVHWKPEYTHPDNAGAGFTSDFSPGETSSSTSSGPSSPGVIELDDDQPGPSSAGSSSSSSAHCVETTLVCARCLDPLVLAAPSGVPEEERKKYRVWALRCGHMLDGKCIAELMFPPPPISVEPTQEECSGKGKGKARAVEPEPPLADTEFEDVHTASTTSDRKGKRKAVEPLDREPSPKRPALDESASQEDNSIRSRLRPRTRGGPEASASVPGLSAAAFEPATFTLATMTRRRGRGSGSGSAARAAAVEGEAHGSRAKGKGRAKAGPKLAIEAEHEWRCPVGGCGRIHYSVRVEGEWRTDEGRGAIALYV